MHARLTDIRDGSKKITIDRDKKKMYRVRRVVGASKDRHFLYK